MKSPIRLFGMVAVVGAVGLTVVPAHAAESEDGAVGHAVFVQTNDTDGNSIAAYHRNSGGTLSYVASHPTGGLGARATGAGSDPLASQGSLEIVPEAGLLLAVNAGSDSISVFEVNGDQLNLTQLLPSGGPFPTGFAVHDELVYVLDAGGDGYVSGYRIAKKKLHPIENSTRGLGLGNAATPQFLSAPAQVGFTPDGDHLIVTTKTHNTVDIFSINDDGRPSSAPVKNSASPVPFAFDFDGAGRMVLNFAGTSALQTFTVNEDNTISPVSGAVSDTRGALCWLTAARGYEFASNTGTGDVSQFSVQSDGTVVLVNAVAASGIPGAVDSGAAGGFFYVQSGSSSSVHPFSIGANGSLTALPVVAVPDGDDQEGIAVS